MPKALHADDGHTTLVLRGEHLRREGDINMLRHTIAHEAHHIAMREEGETLTDLRRRHGYGRETASGYWCFLAGMCAEEHRVDRSLQREFTVDPGWSAHLADVLEGARRTCAESVEPSSTWSLDAAAEEILGVFRQLATLMAYAVAEDLESNGSRAPDRSTPSWQRMVGGSYGRLQEAFAVLPPGDARAEAKALDERALALRSPLQGWLGHIGFTYADRRGGPYFDILAHEF